MNADFHVDAALRDAMPLLWKVWAWVTTEYHWAVVMVFILALEAVRRLRRRNG